MQKKRKKAENGMYENPYRGFCETLPENETSRRFELAVRSQVKSHVNVFDIAVLLTSRAVFYMVNFQIVVCLEHIYYY